MKGAPFYTLPSFLLPTTGFLPVIFLIIVYSYSPSRGISYSFSEHLKAEIDVETRNFVGIL